MGKIVAVVLWAWIPFFWQPLWGQAPGVGVETAHKPKQQTKPDTRESDSGQRGTKDSPFIVEVHNRPKNEEEAAEAQRDKDHADFINRWTLCSTGAAAVFTGLLVWVGWRGVNAAIRTLNTMQTQANLMDRQVTIMQSQTALMEKQTALMEIQYRQ